MTSLRRQTKGFTIIELLIVLVVIAVLATLVTITYAGIRAKSHDSTRESNITMLDNHIEAFYADNGYYPTVTDLQTASWVTTNLKGLNVNALTDPSGHKITGNAPRAGAYVYSYVTQGCKPTVPSSTTNMCTSFTLTAELEGGGTYVRQSDT